MPRDADGAAAIRQRLDEAVAHHRAGRLSQAEGIYREVLAARLHHMARPAEGLAAVVERLRPGGLLKLGLYSKAARRQLDALRTRFAAPPAGASEAEIRAFRRRVLTGGGPGDFPRVTGSLDFNNLSGCRDLLFHVREHRFSLAEIDRLLACHGLAFIGFELSAAAARLYRARFLDDPTMTELAMWARFDEGHPDTFAGMYRFWCRKSGLA